MRKLSPLPGALPGESSLAQGVAFIPLLGSTVSSYIFLSLTKSLDPSKPKINFQVFHIMERYSQIGMGRAAISLISLVALCNLQYIGLAVAVTGVVFSVIDGLSWHIITKSCRRGYGTQSP